MALNVILVITSFIIAILVCSAKSNDQPLGTASPLEVEIIAKTASPLTNQTKTPPKPRPSKVFTRLHGCSMVVGWLGVTPVSAIIARYFRLDNNYPTLISVWFRLHSLLMWSNLFLNILAVIFIYIRVGGWSGTHYHTVIGVITVSLLAIQAVGSTFFRPAIESNRRFIFNGLHRIAGILSYVLSVIAIYCSLDYGVMRTFRSEILWLLNATLITQAITVIALEGHSFAIRNGLFKVLSEFKLKGIMKASILLLFVVISCVYVTAICENILNST